MAIGRLMDRKLLWQFLGLVALPVALLLFSNNLLAQTSPPLVQTFSNQTMGNHSRIFSMDMGDDGVIYAASMDTSEVIAFDGANWFRIEVPTPCAAIQVGKTGKIWVSQVDGIGYLERNVLGQFKYHAFECEFNKARNFFPFWDCARTENGVRFAGHNLIYYLDETTDPPSSSSIVAKKDEVFLNWDGPILSTNTAKSKVMLVEGESRTLFEGAPDSNQFNYLMPFSKTPNVYARDSWRKLSIRKDDQWESFSSEFDELNKNQEFNWLVPMSGDRIGCGGKGGFYCLSQEGKLLYQVKTSDQKNLGPIYTWKEFSDNRIGLACENGFAVLTPTKDRREWPLFKYENVGIYGLHCDKGIVSICSESGIFEIETSSLNSTYVDRPTPINEAVCLDLQANENEFLVASSVGILQKQDSELKTIVDRGATCVARFDKEHLIASDMAGVGSIYRVKDGGFEEINSFPTCHDQAKFLMQEHVVWQSEFRGFISAFEFPNGLENEKALLSVSSDVKYEYASIHGVLNNDFVVLTDSGILVSELMKNSTNESDTGASQDTRSETKIELKQSKRYDQLTETVQENLVTRLVECGVDKIALIGERKVTIHPLVDGVFQADFVAEWEIHPWGIEACWDEKHGLFWQIEQGKLVAIDIDKIQKPHLKPPVIVAETGDNLPEDLMMLSYRGNIKLSFGVPLGNHFLGNVEYQHRLKGLKNEWTDWSSTSEIEYQGLPGGSYEFETRARTHLGESASSILGFQVKFPWFLSWPAIASWLSLFGLTIYGATAWRSRRLVAANRSMEQLVAQRTDEIEQKKIEIRRKAALLDENERRNESDRLKSLDTLVSGIAHDFNNLLMVISSNNEMIQHANGQDIEKFAEDNIVAIQSAADLCRELTDYSGSLPMELVSTSLNRVALESKELIENTARKTERVTYNLVDDANATCILADARILKRALINLVINAVECCEETIMIETSRDTISKQELMTARYVGKAPSPGEYCCLTVRDDGIGIEPDQMERLFDPFFSTKRLGRGLGLAIVMRIVARFNGVIFVESEVGSGARFKLCFPAMPWRTSSQAKIKPSKTKFRRDLKILLVDDELDVLRSTEQVLTACKHQVTASCDPKQALKLIFENDENARPFDCAILDVSMPGMSGPDMAEIILDQVPDMPIVFVSGYSNSDFSIRFLEAPNVVFLSKPFRLQQINQAIHDATSKRSTGKVGQNY